MRRKSFDELSRRPVADEEFDKECTYSMLVSQFHFLEDTFQELIWATWLLSAMVKANDDRL
jgi:hypothetical protein